MDEHDMQGVVVSKLDVTRDHHGSFLSDRMSTVATCMLSCIRDLVDQPTSVVSRWLSTHMPTDGPMKATRDGTGLDTCQKFKVCND